MSCSNSLTGACSCAGAQRCANCSGCPNCCPCGAAQSEDEVRRRGRPARRRRPRVAPVFVPSAPVAVDEPAAVSPSLGPAPDFTPTPVENPGGGRLRDRTPPSRQQIVIVNGVGGKRIPLHRLAATAWQALVAAARRDGVRAPLLLPTSGFRDPAHQERLWRAALQRYGSPQEARKWVAPPGGSAHQTGRAIDFYLGGKNASGNVTQLRTLPAYRWLVANARRFGFYPYEREPWHWEYNPPATGAPRPAQEIAFESAAAPVGRTIYSPIQLGIRNAQGSPVRPQTGIFCPSRWRPGAAVDLVVFLHGIRDPRITIESYWDARRHPHFALREDLERSGKNALLVAPLLGSRSQNQIGILAHAGGFDRWVRAVLQSVQQAGWSSAPPQLGNIILACHSGGGLAMRTIALARNAAAANVRACWGFDCTYNHDDHVAWPRWAAQHPNAQLRLYYLPNTRTQAQARRIAERRVPNITVNASRGKNHNWVPRAHFLELLRAAAVLQNI